MTEEQLHHMLTAGVPLSQALAQLGVPPETTSDSSYLVNNLRRLGVSDDFIINYVLYPSLRPRTDMPFIPRPLPTVMLSPTDIRARANDVIPGIVDSHLLLQQRIIKQVMYIPVTRYQELELYSSAYYFGGEDYCGTFYYFEPSSGYYLRSNRTLVAPNKILALRVLRRQQGVPPPAIMAEAKALLQWHKTSLPANTDDEQWINNLLTDMFSGDYNFKYNPSLYAKEDGFDQPLCIAMRSMQVDCALLTLMTGSTFVVSEILDARPRQESFRNVVTLTM